MAESVSKSLHIKCQSQGFQQGEQVLVVMDQALGYQAVLWGYVLPFLLVVLVLGVTYAMTSNELISGLAGLVSLGPFYLLLWALRKRFEKTFQLTIKKIIP